jgi:hypothetical protein
MTSKDTRSRNEKVGTLQFRAVQYRTVSYSAVQFSNVPSKGVKALTTEL